MPNSDFVPPAPGQSSAKKSPWWLYGLIGCGGLLVVVVLVVVAGGAYLWTKVPKSENEMIAKIIELANPEVEVMEMNTTAGIVTVRNKKTGETLTWNLEDAKQGKFTVTKDGKTESLTFSEDGQMKIESEEGTATLGATVENLPEWLPVYPGAKSEGGMTSSEGQKLAGTIGYTTPDQPGEVVVFYREKLEALGLEPDQDQAYSSSNIASLTAVAPDETRKVTVTASRFGDQTNIQISYSENQY